MRLDRAGMNIYSYVGGNPVSGIDPLGLWSLTLQGYAGLGGGFVIYGSGRSITAASLRFGYGAGLDLQYDPTDQRPGTGDPNCGIGGTSSLGLYGEAGAGIGPISAAVELQTGITTDVQNPSPSMFPFGFYFQPDASYAFGSYPRGGLFRLGLSYAGGVEVTAHGP